MQAERILVTGATGFIGRALVPALLLAGARVRVLARNRARAIALLPGGVEIMECGDIAGNAGFDAACSGVDRVVHLAGLAHAYGVSPQRLRAVNVEATAALGRAAAAAAVKQFVLLSSARALAGAAVSAPLTDSSEPHPQDAYGRSKRDTETALLAIGLPTTILRPVLVCGAGAGGNLARLLKIARTPLPLPFAAIRNRRSVVSLASLVGAISLVLTDSRALGGCYLVADPGPLSLAAMIAELRRAMGRPPGLFPAPPALLSVMMRTVGLAEDWRRLSGDNVVTATGLAALGWRPAGDGRAALASLVPEGLRRC